MHYRFYSYKGRGDELGIEKNGHTFEGGQGPEGAAVPWMDEAVQMNQRICACRK
jgi:hypothetical protein